MAGIVHFANFYAYMEETEHEFFRSLGLQIVDRKPDGTIISWPRVEASCSFHAPAFYGDVLEARLTLERMGEKSLTYRVEFRRGETLVAVGTMKTVCCRLPREGKMSSIPVPPDYAAKLTPHLAE